MLPANLFIYSWLAYSVLDAGSGEDVNVIENLDFTGIFITLAVVLVGIVVGLWVGYKNDDAIFKQRINQFGSVCGLLLILVSAVFGSGAGDSDTTFWSLPWSFYLGTALPCVLGMTLANLISRSFRLAPPETVAISIECCYQNTAIATSVAVTMFSDPDERAEAISVPLLYGLIEALIIGVYCVWAWKIGWTKAPADEKLCVVVNRTYENGAHNEDEEEWEGELPEGFFARLFVPKAVEKRLKDGDVGGSKSKKEPSTPAEKTVSPDPSAPPGTPDTIVQDDEEEQDVETGVSEGSSSSSRDAEKRNLYKKYDLCKPEDGYPTDEQSHTSSLVEKNKPASIKSIGGLTGLSAEPKLPAAPSNESQSEDHPLDESDSRLPSKPSTDGEELE